MTVHTTYFSALSNGSVDPGEGARVLGVVRQPHEWVDDVVDRNVPAVAPPDRLLDACKRVESAAEADGVDEPRATAWSSTRFEERYREYLREDRLEDVRGRLREHGRDGELWLVCYERDPAHCHRRLLATELTHDRPVEPVHHPEPGVDAEQDDGDREQVANARLGEFAEGSP